MRQFFSRHRWFTGVLTVISFFNVALAAATLGNILMAAYALLVGPSTLSWARTEGHVVESYIVQHRGKTSGEEAVIGYTSKVNGVEQNGYRVQYGAIFDEHFSPPWRLQHAYPVGKKIDVFYDVMKPDQAVLLRGAADGCKYFVSGPMIRYVTLSFGLFIFALIMEKRTWKVKVPKNANV